MAEALAGLGVAASVIAVIQITEAVIKLSVAYGSSVKDARTGMQNIRTECESALSVLTRLQGMSTDSTVHPQMPTLQLLIEEDGPLSQYRDQLKSVAAELQLPEGWKGTAEILRWPMKAKRIEKALQIMERKKSLLTLAITMDFASISKVLAIDLSEAKKSLDVISDSINAISEHVASVVDTSDAIMNDSVYKDIIRWLSAPDPTSSHNYACKKRHPETGKWFLDGLALRRWKNEPASLLWLHGIPGSGKSILCSTVVQHISGCFAGVPSVAITYFYFDFQDVEKQKPDNFLRSLIVQLLTSMAFVPECISIPHRRHRDGRQPSTHQLLIMLKSLFELKQDSYLFCDALDECDDQAEILGIITEIVDWKLPNLHILLTSRKERQISDDLDRLVTEQINIQGSFVDLDISIYVRERLRSDRRLGKWTLSVQEEIADTLVGRAEGMFRWAACQLDTLSAFHRLDRLRTALRSLPKDLDETYNRILSKINPEYETDVKKVLQWLAFSARPLRLDEVAETLAIEYYADGPRFNPELRLPDPLDILTMCSSLVTFSVPNDDDEFQLGHLSHYTPGNKHTKMHLGKIRLAHYSVQEYLISDRIRNSQMPVSNYCLCERSAHQVLAETCLIYLLHFEDALMTAYTMELFPLAKYAAVFWPSHAKFGDDVILPGLQPLLLRLFRPHCNQFFNWIRIHNVDEYRFSSRALSETIGSPLYYSCLLGLSAIVKHLADSGADVNEPGGKYGNSLQAASYLGKKTIVRLLLESGANVNAKGGDYGNALYAAASRNHEATVKLLLESGADVNAKGGKYGNALPAAAYQSQEAIVRLLLESGADVNADGGLHGNALLAAAHQDNEEIVRLLLESGADVNANCHGNALYAAASRNHEAIVKLLLESGADVDAVGGLYGNALQAAALQSQAMVRLLMESGADVNADGGWHGNALIAAAHQDNEEIVRLLLESGADVNATGGKYGNALQAAAYRNKVANVRLLLDSGANVNANSGKYGNALLAAFIGGHGDILHLLLESGAKPLW